MVVSVHDAAQLKADEIATIDKLEKELDDSLNSTFVPGSPFVHPLQTMPTPRIGYALKLRYGNVGWDLNIYTSDEAQRMVELKKPSGELPTGLTSKDDLKKYQAFIELSSRDYYGSTYPIKEDKKV